MRIGIDARELGGKPTGVGRYLAELLLAWDRSPQAQEHRFVLYCPEGTESLTPAIQLLVQQSAPFAFRNLPGTGGTIWEQWTLANAASRDRLDVFFAPAYSAPLRLDVPTALTIHDLSFAAHPEWFGAREGLRRRVLTKAGAHKARTVLTDSEFSRRQIVELLGVSPSRVQVIKLGVGVPTALAGGGREPLVLYVGSLFNRRRIPDLIAAFAMVARAHLDARLALVGENRTSPRQDPAALAASAGVADRVEIHRYVPQAALDDLYARARVFVFLSEYEGFGLTPLEALASGLPVVVLDTAIAREIHGDAAEFVALGDIPATAAAIETLLFDEHARAMQLSRAASLLPTYDWDRTAAETLSAIERTGGATAS